MISKEKAESQKKLVVIEKGPPTIEEVTKIFSDNGVFRLAESVRGMKYLLNSDRFASPKYYARVWRTYAESAKK